jgi:hypothetical protein
LDCDNDSGGRPRLGDADALAAQSGNAIEH